MTIFNYVRPQKTFCYSPPLLLHVYHNLPVPLITTPRIQLALKSLSHHAPEVKQALPITFAIMQGFRKLLTNSMQDMALWTCMTVLFFWV